MRRFFTILLCLSCPLFLFAQEEEVAVPLPLSTIELKVQGQTWFTDTVGVAYATFDTVVETPMEWPSDPQTYYILDIEVEDISDDAKVQSMAVIRFLPRKTGAVTLPAFTFASETKRYQTKPHTINVSQPRRSEAMSLSLAPRKQTIYVGEPLRIDFAWECQLPANSIKALKLYPDFFNDPNIEIFIPRNTSDEDTQLGLPIGGRRVIGNRTIPTDHPKFLGKVELPLYLRFSTPGTYTLPETRLECAQIEKSSGNFANYAAHFNNALFEATDPDIRHERLYTTAPELQIEVLPLPQNTTGNTFSGLYAPVDIQLSLSPTQIDIGQLMELEIKLSGNNPHGMLDLPQLSYQSGLRTRFLVDDDYGRLWHEAGTIFRTRLRALTTSISAFPSLKILVFNTETGSYETHTTAPIPLKVSPRDGQNFIPLKSFKDAAITLTNQPEGIWHNLKANRMNDLLNTLFNFLNNAFWALLLVGPIAFALLLPIIREQRRRANNPLYRSRAQAYAVFKKTPANAKEKWPAFLTLMAAYFETDAQAWTLRNSLDALKSIDASPEEIEDVTRMHQGADARDFSQTHPETTFSNLDSIAKRALQKISIFALSCFLLSQLMTPQAEAADWDAAEALFNQALVAPAGSDTANALYSDAALKFQSESAIATHPDAAWHNAGNAWFQAGSIGRAILAYRMAKTYRPFDPKLDENLATARAMALNDLPPTKTTWQHIPLRWIQPVLVIVNICFWFSLLLTLRYRKRSFAGLSIALGACLLVAFSIFIIRIRSSEPQGVVIVDSLDALKGPGHGYAKAFSQAIHDGVEFTLIENRGEWGLVELTDGRQCWVLLSQTALLPKTM